MDDSRSSVGLASRKLKKSRKVRTKAIVGSSADGKVLEPQTTV